MDVLYDCENECFDLSPDHDLLFDPLFDFSDPFGLDTDMKTESLNEYFFDSMSCVQVSVNIEPVIDKQVVLASAAQSSLNVVPEQVECCIQSQYMCSITPLTSSKNLCIHHNDGIDLISSAPSKSETDALIERSEMILQNSQLKHNARIYVANFENFRRAFQDSKASNRFEVSFNCDIWISYLESQFRGLYSFDII